MEQIKFIKISELQDIKKLVNLASKIDGEIIVTKGHFNISVKSVLGLLSLDLSNGVKITYPYNKDLDNFLQSFEF